ncbi:aldolase/citrate lyase family protein [Pectobacteriaceae bacterium CE70]|uniref:HpcH/HpaI aldolase family protein n=1 Tax=Brenneria uluponensis TaxID=3057057 RepID=UPI0028EE1AE9|nr:aldolase/citrate lyase family protein [Brenneria ulupoensis]WJV61869.1 aldolase/citrate lyase family protein [Pectobacteriaceae bacterium C52]WJV66139.1 aldolase/citrate lyase family protein [Pectobacteriaceae bacterium CE70]WJY10152.1 aldolase/citrate lyase family protein [Pectobacteriaceae bacterium C80]
MPALYLLSDRLQQQHPLFGILNSVSHPTLVEMIACAGYDFVILDMEHLPHNETLLSHCIQIAQLNGCAPLVRLTVNDLDKVGRVLDMGAHGIVLSRTETGQQVRALRDAICFPPRGRRGITGGTVTGFGTRSLPDYIQQANEQVLLIPMIESRAGVESIDDILAIEGVSMVMEGALDLALDLGLGPTPHHPDVEVSIRQIATRCKHADIPFCANPRTPEQQHFWQQAGIQLWLCGEDRGFLFRTLRQRLQDIKASS